jgi:hypothetical protein
MFDDTAAAASRRSWCIQGAVRRRADKAQSARAVSYASIGTLGPSAELTARGLCLLDPRLQQAAIPSPGRDRPDPTQTRVADYACGTSEMVRYWARWTAMRCHGR